MTVAIDTYHTDDLRPMQAIAQDGAETPEEYTEGMLKAAKIIAEAPMDKLQSWENFFSGSIREDLAAFQRGEEINFEQLSEKIHLLIMVHWGIVHRDSRQLEDLARGHVRVLRDKIKGTYNTWDQLAVSIVSGGITMVAGLTGMGAAGATMVPRLAALLGTAVDVASVVQISTFAGHVGSGIQSIFNFIPQRHESKRSWLQVEQQLIQDNRGEHRNNFQTADQKTSEFLQIAQKMLESIYNTKLTINR